VYELLCFPDEGLGGRNDRVTVAVEEVGKCVPQDPGVRALWRSERTDEEVRQGGLMLEVDDMVEEGLETEIEQQVESDCE